MDGSANYLTKRQIEQTMESVLAPTGIMFPPPPGMPPGMPPPGAGTVMMMQMDQGAPKRYKSEEVLGDQNGLKIATRIVMNRSDMSKVIGKGGANIALIRTNCGAFVKGFDIDSESRLIVINGQPGQVFAAFEVVIDILYNSHQNSPHSAEFQAQLLIENSKAGKVVGPKGATIQAMKAKSGALQVRLQKDPKDVGGVPLRVVTIDGSLTAVKRAHVLLHELISDGSISAAALQGHNFMSSSSFAPSILDHMSSPSGGMSSTTGSSLAPLPMQDLLKVGVQQETVRQLTDMKSYLAAHFGLELSICPIPGMMAANVLFPGGGFSSQNLSHNQNQNQAQNQNQNQNQAQSGGFDGFGQLSSSSSGAPHFNPNDAISFTIPTTSAGGIIGQRGQGLRDIMGEFGGVKVYIERDFTKSGLRKVILHSGSLENRLLCKTKISEMSNDPKYFNISTRPTPMVADPSLPTDVPDDINVSVSIDASADEPGGYDGSAFGEN